MKASICGKGDDRRCAVALAPGHPLPHGQWEGGVARWPWSGRSRTDGANSMVAIEQFWARKEWKAVTLMKEDPITFISSPYDLRIV
ncbi:hypothetical protein [Phyllobacterium myrsinacearum]|uniref:hypothetical protein n=1 Tax=Phyllobacterium myrsinacearum TaxID=28101 RepID=UPI001028C5E7|nr:hypothetical protein [Phyllobacterium myrsinacearum]